MNSFLSFGCRYLKISFRRYRVFSGIQPTGIPHLGNYFGAIKEWEKLQHLHSCLFCIVDLHAITLPQDPQKLRENIQLMTASLLACGIDPEKSIFFLQSQVPQHAELSWILGSLVTMARLHTLPQFKEKSSQMKDIPFSLFSYPVLQSADILLYKAQKVPVGEDQLQHIQLARRIAEIFNNRFKDIFPVPEALLNEHCARIKGLKHPEKKMSKSDLDHKNRIELRDNPDVIRSRIKSAKTDFTSAVTFDPDNRPGVSNLILMHSLCTRQTPEEICAQNSHLDTGQYKGIVAEVVIEHLRPIQQNIESLLSDPQYLMNVLIKGSEKAEEIALGTMSNVKDLVGLSVKGTASSEPKNILNYVVK